MTTDAATYVPPTVQHAVTWQALTLANPSLQSWERSAATAGSRGLWWWPSWCFASGVLRSDVSHAIEPDAPPEAFWAALAVARQRISEVFHEEERAAKVARHVNPIATDHPKPGFQRDSGRLPPDSKTDGRRSRHA